MYRRTFLGAAALGATGLAGCTGRSSSSTSQDGSADPENQAASSTATPATTPSSAGGSHGENSASAGSDDDAEFASGQRAPSLAAESVSVSGVGKQNEAGYFVAEGGPVLFTYSAATNGERTANFDLTVTGNRGTGIQKRLRTELGIHTQDVVRGRIVEWLAPGEYKISVGTSSIDGAVEWEVTVEQPGLVATGATAPFVIQSEHVDVVGPVSLVGPTRVTLESLGTHYANDFATASNHIVSYSDQRGGNIRVVLNELETGPRTYSDVFDGSSVDVGYFQVTGTRVPWRLTVEPF